MTPFDALIAKLRPAWHAQAACKGKGDLMFPPEGKRRHTEARRICASCPVRDQCLAEALDDPTLVGIWGGLTPRERGRLRAGRDRSAA